MTENKIKTVLTKIIITVLCFGAAIGISCIIFFAALQNVYNFEGAVFILVFWMYILNPVIIFITSTIMGYTGICPKFIIPAVFLIIFEASLEVMKLAGWLVNMYDNWVVNIIIGLFAYSLPSFIGISIGYIIKNNKPNKQI